MKVRVYFTLKNGQGCELEGEEENVLRLVNKLKYRINKEFIESEGV